MFHRMLLWGLFFAICFGLGYPTLNRYDPRRTGGTSDSKIYYKVVVDEPQAGNPYEKYRVLIPFFARSIYHCFAKGRVGTWNTGFFALLVVNAAFCATAAYLLIWVGYRVTGNGPIALLGAMLYLLNFTLSNEYLSGLVDSGQSCFTLAVIWALLTNQWGLLPLFCSLGALAKETFIPFSVLFATVWWLTAEHRDRKGPSPAVWIVAMFVLSSSALWGVNSLVSGCIVRPWTVVRVPPSGSFLNGLFGCLLNRTLLYDFAWLFPLGIWRWGRLPRPWVFASCVTALAVLAGGAYYHISTSSGRVLFSFMGPLMSLSAAILLTEWIEQIHPGHKGSAKAGSGGQT